MKVQTLVPLAAAAAAQLLVVGNIAAAFAFQQKPPVETLVTVPVVAEIEQVECVRQDPVPYEPVTYQVPLDAELQSYTEKMCDLYDVPLELAYAVMQVESGFTPAARSSTGDYGLMQIQAKIEEKKAAGQYAYEMQVIKNHLSEAKCNDFLARNMQANSVYVPMHVHVDKENAHDCDGEN